MRIVCVWSVFCFLLFSIFWSLFRSYQLHLNIVCMLNRLAPNWPEKSAHKNQNNKIKEPNTIFLYTQIFRSLDGSVFSFRFVSFANAHFLAEYYLCLKKCFPHRFLNSAFTLYLFLPYIYIISNSSRSVLCIFFNAHSTLYTQVRRSQVTLSCYLLVSVLFALFWCCFAVASWPRSRDSWALCVE